MENQTNKDIAIFIEVSNYCKFNCSGCNINKVLKPNNINVKKLFKIYNFFNKNDIDNITFLLGPGDFFRNENLKYYNEIIINYEQIFKKNNYRNILFGNISTNIINNKVLEFLKNNKFFFQPGIIFNPLMKKENKKIFLTNIKNLSNIYNFGKVPVFINLSSCYFEHSETIDLIFDFLEEIKYICNIEYFEGITLVFNPNKLSIQKKEFKIDLKTQTEWYLKFWKNKKEKKFLKKIVYEGLFLQYFEKNKLYIEPYYIDKNLRMYPIIEHIGDLILNNLSKNYEIINIEKEFKITKKEFLNKLSNIKRKIVVDNKKKLLKDKICKNCIYLDFCSRQSIAINKELYKNTILGKETEEYCLGHKKLNNFILKSITKDKENY